jgi:hypothetical protein
MLALLVMASSSLVVAVPLAQARCALTKGQELLGTGQVTDAECRDLRGVLPDGARVAALREVRWGNIT